MESEALTELDFSRNTGSPDACIAIAALVQRTSTLAHLKLDSMALGDEGARNLCHGLLDNCTLVELTVASNEFGHVLPSVALQSGAAALLMSVSEHYRLTRLCLAWNSLGDGCSKHIAALLSCASCVLEVCSARPRLDASRCVARCGRAALSVLVLTPCPCLRCSTWDGRA
jgi:hypothetical protein